MPSPQLTNALHRLLDKYGRDPSRALRIAAAWSVGNMVVVFAIMWLVEKWVDALARLT